MPPTNLHAMWYPHVDRKKAQPTAHNPTRAKGATLARGGGRPASLEAQCVEDFEQVFAM